MVCLKAYKSTQKLTRPTKVKLYTTIAAAQLNQARSTLNQGTWKLSTAEMPSTRVVKLTPATMELIWVILVALRLKLRLVPSLRFYICFNKARKAGWLLSFIQSTCFSGTAKLSSKTSRSPSFPQLFSHALKQKLYKRWDWLPTVKDFVFLKLNITTE